MIQTGTRESRPRLRQCRLDFFAGDYEWKEDGFAGALVISGQARQPVSAVNQLFYVKLQMLTTEVTEDTETNLLGSCSSVPSVSSVVKILSIPG